MIPLGIYRTERVSFQSLDPSYKGGSDDEDDSIDLDQANINDLDDLDGPGLTKKKSMRGKRAKEAAGGAENTKQDNKKEIKYVISNPDEDLRLKINDLVFVLS